VVTEYSRQAHAGVTGSSWPTAGYPTARGPNAVMAVAAVSERNNVKMALIRISVSHIDSHGNHVPGGTSSRSSLREAVRARCLEPCRHRSNAI
jgi:hypothetical protein